MRVSSAYSGICLCSFLAMVNQLQHLEALVVCHAWQMDGDFDKLESHPSLQTIKLMVKRSSCKAFTSALGLRQLQELWIEDLEDTELERDVVSFSLSSRLQPTERCEHSVMSLQVSLCGFACWHGRFQSMKCRVQGNAECDRPRLARPRMVEGVPEVEVFRAGADSLLASSVKADEPPV